MDETKDIVLITHADTTSGSTAAREHLTAGHRVAVTARHPSSLSRILLGQSADRVLAVAADVEDDAQRDAVLERARARFGAPVTRIIDGRYADCSTTLRLQIAS